MTQDRGASNGKRPTCIILASGGEKPNDGGSGVEWLVSNNGAPPDERPVFDVQILAVVSQHENGGVYTRMRRLGIPFYHVKGPFTAATYIDLAEQLKPDFFFLSGWDLLVKGIGEHPCLMPNRIINIHPSLIHGGPDLLGGPPLHFGGPGYHGLVPHEKVIEAFRQGRTNHTAVCIHCCTRKFDDGPIVYRRYVPLRIGETPQQLQDRCKETEHADQAFIYNLIAHGAITWSGQKGEPVEVPPWYFKMACCPRSCVVRRSVVYHQRPSEQGDIECFPGFQEHEGPDGETVLVQVGPDPQVADESAARVPDAPVEASIPETDINGANQA